MTNDEFCKIDNAFYGNAVDNIKQIKLRSFNGEELKEYVEAAINYTHCCTEFFCEDEDLQYSSKKCKEQCSSCKWIEKL